MILDTLPQPIPTMSNLCYSPSLLLMIRTVWIVTVCPLGQVGQGRDGTWVCSLVARGCGRRGKMVTVLQKPCRTLTSQFHPSHSLSTVVLLSSFSCHIKIPKWNVQLGSLIWDREEMSRIEFRKEGWEAWAASGENESRWKSKPWNVLECQRRRH